MAVRLMSTCSIEIEEIFHLLARGTTEEREEKMLLRIIVIYLFIGIIQFLLFRWCLIIIGIDGFVAAFAFIAGELFNAQQ